MRILYIGDRARGVFIEEVCKSNANDGWVFDFIEASGHLKTYEPELLSKLAGYNYVVYDTEPYIDDAEDLAAIIESIYKANAVTPIVMVNTINPTNTMVKACLNRGIKRFINLGVGSVSDLKEQLVKNISNYYEANGREEVNQVKETIEEERANISRFTSIAVVGTEHRIGTTTQAIQIVKFLTSQGFRACYVEINDNKYTNRYLSQESKDQLSYVEKLKLMVGGEVEDADRGYLRTDGVDMFYKQDKLADLFKEDYDYLVYDYGMYRSAGFNKTAFLKDDIKLICTCANVIEFDGAIEIATNPSYNSAKLICSFSAQKDREDVKEIFAEYNADNRLYFTDYTPDPYILTNITLYKELLKTEAEEPTPEEPEKKKWKFFKR